MSRPSLPQTTEWVRCTPTYVETLPVLSFPFEAPPDIYLPACTVLQLKDGTQVYTFKWCYLSRRGTGRNVAFEANSLSAERVHAMPKVLRQLSKWFRFRDARPLSLRGDLDRLTQLLDWTDQPYQGRKFEAILSDLNLALEALQGYHSYLRSLLQAHQITSVSAGRRDQAAIDCLSEIHGLVYRDHIEPLEARKGSGTVAPESADVAQFGSTLQAIFDSAAAMVLQGIPGVSVRALRTCASDASKSVDLREQFGPLRLAELACVAYAGLVAMDSGANLSVLTRFEEPEDLLEQLADPDRVNLKEKAIKFRAGGKLVEVFLSATSVTRLKTYLMLRQHLVAAFDGADVAPLLIQCEYANSRVEPFAVRALDRFFLTHLRNKVAAVGANLPAVTLRQLRTYAQQRFVRTAPLPVAAKRMGHSVETAIKAYCKAQEVTHRGEMADFLGSLQRTVLNAPENGSEDGSQSIPAGACANYGNPPPTTQAAPVQPDCNKVEGCFFCGNYRVHADEHDMRKLMSSRRVLAAIAPLQGDSIRAEQVYRSVVDRIDALLGELSRRQPKVYEAVRMEVEDRGQLTGYWARKLQQLHLLGMVPLAMGSAT